MFYTFFLTNARPVDRLVDDIASINKTTAKFLSQQHLMHALILHATAELFLIYYNKYSFLNIYLITWLTSIINFLDCKEGTAADYSLFNWL
jgi:hypothetical protein